MISQVASNRYHSVITKVSHFQFSNFSYSSFKNAKWKQPCTIQQQCSHKIMLHQYFAVSHSHLYWQSVTEYTDSMGAEQDRGLLMAQPAVAFWQHSRKLHSVYSQMPLRHRNLPQKPNNKVLPSKLKNNKITQLIAFLPSHSVTSIPQMKMSITANSTKSVGVWKPSCILSASQLDNLYVNSRLSSYLITPWMVCEEDQLQLYWLQNRWMHVHTEKASATSSDGPLAVQAEQGTCRYSSDQWCTTHPPSLKIACPSCTSLLITFIFIII